MRHARARRRLAAAPILFLVASVLSGAAPATTGPSVDPRPPEVLRGPEVRPAAHHDVSPPLRMLRPTAPSAATLTERPLRSPGEPLHGGPDAATQGTATTTSAPVVGAGFEGVGDGVYGGYAVRWAPPDTVGAAGLTQYVQAVNDQLMVFDKTGGVLWGPVGINTVWSGFGGACQSNNDGDPVVVYDKLANRWVISQFSVSTTPYAQCIAVSTGPDALGSYNRYIFTYSAFNDYPKIGVWPDAYYVTYNMFGTRFQGAKACALDRTAMLAGAAATQQCFDTTSASLLPSDLDGRTLPPAGSPNLLMNRTTNALNLWRFHVDWGAPANSTFTGPVAIPVASYTPACSGGVCIPQPNTSQKLDSLADRLMFRLAYRNFGDHESLVVTHSVTPAAGISGIRWYELRNATGQTMASAPPIVYQESTYAPDATARWLGSAAMDASGGIAVGYNVASTTVKPGLRFAVRTSGDTISTLQSETVIIEGTGSQLKNLSRWGDYAAMTIDPVDDCTFWFTGEYMAADGTWNWHTRIASFRLPNCVATTPPGPLPPAAPASLTTSATDGSVSLSWSAVGGATDYVITRNGTTVLDGTTATSWTDRGTQNGSTYTYIVAARNEGGAGSGVSAIATPGVPTPTLTAATGAGRGIQLSWSTPVQSSTNLIVGYTIYRRTANTSLTKLTDVGIVNTYKDQSTSRGVTYFYVIEARYTSGTSPRSTEASATAK